MFNRGVTPESYSIEIIKGVTVVTFDKEANVPDVMRMFKDMLVMEVNGTLTRLILYDVRRGVKGTAREARSIAKYFLNEVNVLPIKAAILVKDPIAFGLAKIFCKFHKLPLTQLRAFRAKDGVWEWLLDG